MSRKKVKRIIAAGLVCVALLLVSVWQANTFHDGRLVKPTSFGDYEFQASDLPMLVSVGLTAAYGIYLAVLLIRSILSRRPEEEKRTRTIDPRLGWLGFLGLLGFGGFATYSLDGSIFPFVFFVFFGFFGFRYEGKMSGVLKDERFRENRDRAQLKALKTGMVLLYAVLLSVGLGAFSANLERCAVYLVIAISLIVAAVMFLGEYLLYRYDCQE